MTPLQAFLVALGIVGAINLLGALVASGCLPAVGFILVALLINLIAIVVVVVRGAEKID
jgi:hypothetical protein